MKKSNKYGEFGFFNPRYGWFPNSLARYYAARQRWMKEYENVG